MKHTQHRTRFLVATIAAILIGALSACSSSSSGVDTYPGAAHVFNLEAQAYHAAVVKVEAARAIGKVSQAQWDALVADEHLVLMASNVLTSDLSEWRSSGFKPPGFDADAQNVRDPQNRIKALADEVSK